MNKFRSWPDKVTPGDWSNDLLSEDVLKSFSRRASSAASLINSNSTVLDLGCAECAIKPFLPEGVGYTGCDLEPLAPDILRINLDAHEFPNGSWDYVLLLGVLSWISEKEWTLRMARQRAKFAIVTNGEPIFGKLLKNAGWEHQKEIMGELSEGNQVAINLYK